ncbi:MAG TPA: hypothetical protein VK893_07760, partial [Pyrinomonadaceae bacterium]|nr:hypothetical protein [Pyrinomonadaceae bacterium]
MEIEFDEYQSRWLRERSAFHPTEQREEVFDGRLRLILTALAGVNDRDAVRSSRASGGAPRTR